MSAAARHYRRVIDSPAGPLTIGVHDDTLTHVLFGERELPNACDRSTPVLAQAIRQIGEYFRAGRRTFDLPIDPRGTPFQSKIFGALRSVPYGVTLTYGQLAARISSPRAFQAAGQAVGANPIGIVIPCHRVIPATGLIGGFAGGEAAKKALLEVEGFVIDSNGLVLRA